MLGLISWFMSGPAQAQVEKTLSDLLPPGRDLRNPAERAQVVEGMRRIEGERKTRALAEAVRCRSASTVSALILVAL